MGDVINLNKFRKRKQRVAAKQKAKENRIIHGTPSEVKSLHETQKALSEKQIEQRKLELLPQSHAEAENSADAESDSSGADDSSAR